MADIPSLVNYSLVNCVLGTWEQKERGPSLTLILYGEDNPQSPLFCMAKVTVNPPGVRHSSMVSMLISKMGTTQGSEISYLPHLESLGKVYF